MNAFSIIIPYVGMGATSSNVNGNFRPHTIVACNKSVNEISTTLDTFSINEESGEKEYKTNRDGDKIEWVKKDNGNADGRVFVPKFPNKNRYIKLIINQRDHYTNNNL